MAELDFKRNVRGVTEQPLPKSYQGNEKVQTTSTPDFQGAVSNYAESTNWMSSIGSTVAAKAANSLATKLGSELGKNPQGDIGLPLTDFDKVMQDSYKTQAQATLGLQANKLITDSNIEMAKANRITPDLIANTNKKITIGLQSIFKNAPAEVQGHLEYQYGNVLLDQTEQLSRRMFGEQRQDRANNTALSSQINSEHSYSFNVNGNEKAAKSALDNTIALNKADVAARIISPQQAKTNIDTARQSYKSGKLIHDYEKSNNKADFLKSLSNGDVSDPDYLNTTNNLLGYVRHQETLRNDSEQLTMGQFDLQLASSRLSGNTIPGSTLADLQNNLSPANFQKTLLKYFDSLKSSQEQAQQQALLGGGFDNPDIWARTTDDAKNKAYDNKVRTMIENSKNSQHPVQLDEAEGIVASQALGPIGTFTNLLNAKFKSTDPSQIESGIRQAEYLYNSKKGANLSNVEDRALSRAALYEVYRQSMPAQDAANLSNEKIYNIKKEDYEILNTQWKDYKINVLGGQNSISYYSKIAGIDMANLTDPLGFQSQADLLYEGNFFATRGNKEATEKMFIRDIKSHYGDSYVNGSLQTTYLPIENFYGLPTQSQKIALGNEENFPYLLKPVAKEMQLLANTVLSYNKPPSSVGLIQEDIIDSVSGELGHTKELYEQGKSLYYWEIEPRPSFDWAIKNKNKYDSSTQKINNLDKYSNGSPIMIHRINKNGTRDTYQLIVKSNPFLSQIRGGSGYVGGWNVMLASNNKSGFQSLGLLLGNDGKEIMFRPDINKTREKYFKGYSYGK